MEKEEILSRLKNVKKGRYVSLQKKKDLGEGFTKISDLVIRLGVNYANMKINEGRTTGSLPWGHWVEGLENLVIEHKGNFYLRVTSAYSKNGKSAYYYNGKPVDKSFVIERLGEKKVASNNPDVYNIKFENILELNLMQTCEWWKE